MTSDLITTLTWARGREKGLPLGEEEEEEEKRGKRKRKENKWKGVEERNKKEKKN